MTGRGALAGEALFSGLDIALFPARWTCLLGVSGVGKTSVLRLLAGLPTPVSFTGELPQFSDGAAFMAQDDLLFPWLTVLQNTCLGARLRGEAQDTERARNLLAQVGLAAHCDKKPAALSGGQRQRVALARTLMEARPVVLLDEPFSALDAQTRSEMQDLAARLLADKTVLLVTHDIAEAARLGHQIYAMSAQKTVEIAAPAPRTPREFDAPDVLRCQGDLRRYFAEGTQ
jgi:putative hydroxymethylpyrimidine transport system ATP-binding protein